MKVLYQDKQQIFFRFDRHESVWEKLISFAKQEQLSFATFQAIGACGRVVLSYYNLPDKAYEDKTIEEDMEILIISGNIALLKGEYTIHAHGSFGKKDLSVIGGHIKEIVVSATCEVMVHILPPTIERAFDAQTGLNLLK